MRRNSLTRACPNCGHELLVYHATQEAILRYLETVPEASPKEIADAIGEKLGNVSYHVRRLAEFGDLRLVRTVPRRGAVEHFYEVAR